MFQNITDKLGKFFAWVLICLVAFSFIIWGIGDVFKSSGGDYAAMVGNKKISIQEFREATQKQAAQLRNILKDNQISEEMTKELENATLNGLIREKLLASELEDQNILIGDSQVAKIIYSEPSFKDDAGNFQPSAFRDFLNRIGKSETDYMRAVKFEMAANALLPSIVGIDLVPSALIKSIYMYNNEQRVISYIVVSSENIKAIPAATDAELGQFYEKNRNLFSVPEQRDVTYLEISKDTVKPGVITEEQVRAEYEKQKKSYVKQEIRTFEQLFFDNEEEAKKISEKLKAEKDFKKFERNGQYTVLEKVKKSDLPPELANSGFSLGNNQISQPFKSSLGWHILKVIDVKEVDFPSYEALKTEIRNDLKEKNDSEYLYNTGTKIEDELAAGTTFEEISKQFNIPLKRVSGIVKGKNPGSGIESADEFISATFATELNSDSGIRTTKDNKGFVLRVDSLKPLRIRAIDEVRGLVEQAWKEEKRDEMTKKIAEGIKEEAKDRSNFEQTAKKEGFNTKNTPSIKRDQAVSGLPRAFVEAMFANGKEGIVGPFPDNSGNYIVGVVEKVIKPEFDKADKDSLQVIKQNLEKEYREDLYEQYFNYLKSKYSVRLGNVVESTP